MQYNVIALANTKLTVCRFEVLIPVASCLSFVIPPEHTAGIESVTQADVPGFICLGHTDPTEK